MPESFDSMLEELADAAATATVPPGLDEVRRRARERVVHRRMAVSALVLVLIGGSGGVWAAANHHTSTNATVGPLGATTTAAIPSPPRSSGAASPSPYASSGDYAFTGGTELTVWKTTPMPDGYLLVFSDGVVALSTVDSFPLCYGQVKTFATAPAAVVSGVPTMKESLVNVACDDFGTTSGLSIDPLLSGKELQLAVPANGGGASTVQIYGRETVFGTSPLAYTAMPPTLSGTWRSADGNNRTLVVGSDGSVSFTATTAGKEYTGTGMLDTQYATGARAVISCATGNGNGTPCGVLLIEQNPKTSDAISVYGSYGPEPFIRTG
jgi:hypothetical protein